MNDNHAACDLFEMIGLIETNIVDTDWLFEDLFENEFATDLRAKDLLVVHDVTANLNLNCREFLDDSS